MGVPGGGSRTSRGIRHGLASSIVILPIVALIVLRGAGGFLVDGPTYLAGAAVLLLIAIGGLRLAVALFGRESILTRLR